MDPKERRWLIWSFEHNAWWRPASNGYTPKIEDAGRYCFEEALEIVIGANEHSYEPNEAMLPEPRRAKL